MNLKTNVSEKDNLYQKMSLQDTLNTHLKEAMKQKYQVKLGTLRLLKSALQNKAIELKVDSLDDEIILTVIRKELKKRQDSIESYESAGRQELADKEKEEADILSEYLPAMMSEDDVSVLVDKVISGGEKNFGLIMKTVMADSQGQADGKLVQQLVKKKLGT